MHSYDYNNKKNWPIISTYSANLQVFVIESHCVLYDVRTGYFYVLQIHFRLQRGNVRPTVLWDGIVVG